MSQQENAKVDKKWNYTVSNTWAQIYCVDNDTYDV